MKKGFELSMNFLVTIIISITIFIFGINFIYTLASDATELEGLSTDQLDNRIGQLLCESTEKVCIGLDKKIIGKGKFDVFGMKIINILTNQNEEVFKINITANSYMDRDKKISKDIDILNKINIKYKSDIPIKRNGEEDIGVGVGVMKDALPGIYILNVTIEYPYNTLHKIYVEVP